MANEILSFYSDIDRLRKINSALSDMNFFEEQGYGKLKNLPEELLTLAFPVFSPLPFLQKFDRVLDIGCGAGLDIFLMKRSFPETAVVGVDLSMALLKENKRFNNCPLVLSHGMRLPFKEKSFDCVIMNGFFNLVADKGGLLKEIKVLLRGGGALFIADIFKKKDVYIPKEGGLLNMAGALKLKELFSLFKGHGFRYEKGRFRVDYTKEFGLFGILWRKV